VRSPAVTLGAPIVSLGAPVAVSRTAPASALSDPQLVPVSYQGSTIDAPQAIIRAQAPDVPPPLPPGPPPVVVPGGPPGPVVVPGAPGLPADPYNCGVAAPPPASGGFLDNCKQKLGDAFGSMEAGGRHLFQSDHCFDEFISPVSSPFLSEDPRSLTEIRPIFMLQGTPGNTPFLHGGTIEFFGAQARLALTDRLSFVVNKIGWDWINVREPADGIESGNGFSELWLGPKYTFLRNECTHTLGAAGVTFQIPAGSGAVFQDTGDLSVAPYVSLAQRFFQTSYGTFDAMGTLGYTFSDNERAEYLYFNTHLDYDVANLHKIYPLIELNWIHYTTAGQNLPAIGFEGGDLFNLGTRGQSGKDNLTLALGARYKFTEWAQIGSTIEFPIIERKDLMQYRWTIDLIFRY